MDDSMIGDVDDEDIEALVAACNNQIERPNMVDSSNMILETPTYSGPMPSTSGSQG